jgi:hypothetical protein
MPGPCAYLLVDHLRWLESESLSLDSVKLPDLQFLATWLAGGDVRLAGSATRFTGSQAYDLRHLRADLERFTFLLGGSDTWPSIQPGQD